MNKKCFEFEEYKSFLQYWILTQPHRGRGLYRKLAQYLKIHTTMMSHVMRGKQHFTEDQALALSEYMGLGELEADYFLELVRFDRATTFKLRQRIKKRLALLREQGQEIKNRIVSHHKLSAEDSAKFYSNWFYSALRLLTDIQQFQDRARLVEALDIPRETANEVISFLLETNLCREDQGKIVIGPSRTHLPADSPHIWTMHKNWRLKAMGRHAQGNATELFYSAPMSVAHDDVKRIRELIVQTVEQVTKIAAQSKAEKLVGLNIDWFQIK